MPWLAVLVLAAPFSEPCAGAGGPAAIVRGEAVCMQRTVWSTDEARCAAVLAGIRTTLRDQELRAGRRMPPPERLRAQVIAAMGTREELERTIERQSDFAERLRLASIQSEAEPTRDYAIWKELLSESMSYQAWRSLREQNRGGEVARLPRRVTVQPEDYERMIEQLGDFLLEGAFQSMVLERRGGNRWDDAVQDEFWKTVLKDAAVEYVDRPCVGPDVAALRRPRVAQAEKKGEEKK